MIINKNLSNVLVSRLGIKILVLKGLALQYMPTISLTQYYKIQFFRGNTGKVVLPGRES